MSIIEQTLAGPSTSDWLKIALTSALARDPVDASNDAQRLAALLDRHAQDTLAAALELVRPAQPGTDGLPASSGWRR